jgi:hypothetical protein
MSSYNLDSTIYFGKFKGKTMRQIVDVGSEGKNYLLWAAGKLTNFTLENDVETYIKTGKVIEVKPDLSMYDENEFFDSIILNGTIDEIPF